MKKIRLDEQCISDPVLLEYNLIQIIADKSSFMLMYQGPPINFQNLLPLYATENFGCFVLQT